MSKSESRKGDSDEEGGVEGGGGEESAGTDGCRGKEQGMGGARRARNTKWLMQLMKEDKAEPETDDDEGPLIRGEVPHGSS